MARPRPAFDGFATHASDCLIDLESGDYANQPDVAAYLSLFGRPSGTHPDTPSTSIHLETGRKYLAEAFKRREGLFIDPALLPPLTRDLPLADVLIPQAGHQGCRPAWDRHYAPWASMLPLIPTTANQAGGSLSRRWAANMESGGWKLSGLTPFLLGWNEDEWSDKSLSVKVGPKGEGRHDAGLLVKTNIRAPIPASVYLHWLSARDHVALARELYSDLFNVVYQAFHTPHASYLELVHRALAGIPEEIEWESAEFDEFTATPVWDRPADQSLRYLVGDWARPTEL
ncbi:hypothetical protein CspHIS471_0604330 [Cutaneotrichosporon sp. HIS471]|nr:hypothetical protein CspHIS471_0604330 [Cutaneotrichosporon sp. HIS471]